MLLVTVLVAAVVVLVVHRISQPAKPTAERTSTPPASSPDPGPTTSFQPAPFTVTELGHPLLDATGTEELFGRGPGVVVRIELARGRITTTPVPDLDSSGPVSFVVTRHEAIVRPLDLVPGYEVPDGSPARPFTGPLRTVQSGPMFPGPDGDSVWAPPTDDNQPVFRLVRLDGREPASQLDVPRGATAIAGVADGSGHVAFTVDGDSYDSSPAGPHRVASGSLVAVGPTRWLTRTCDGSGACPVSVVDPRTGANSELARAIGNSEFIPGVVSPDGSAAAVVVLSRTPALLYFDLWRRTESVLPIRPDTLPEQAQSLVWSPDSRWLFALDATGDVLAVDARTRQITDFRAIGAVLPSLTQLAIR